MKQHLCFIAMCLFVAGVLNGCGYAISTGLNLAGSALYQMHDDEYSRKIQPWAHEKQPEQPAHEPTVASTPPPSAESK